VKGAAKGALRAVAHAPKVAAQKAAHHAARMGAPRAAAAAGNCDKCSRHSRSLLGQICKQIWGPSGCLE
jgi:hypothetical protein